MNDILFYLLTGVVAFLYASVGHGGASGYIALMVIFGIAPGDIRSSALLLNLMVSAIAFYQFRKQGHFEWNMLLPFIITSMPAAYLGAGIPASGTTFRIILAIILVIAVLRLFWQPDEITAGRKINTGLALLLGAGIGLISGMIGIGGGVLLSPVLLLMRWSSLKQAAAVSSAFIFLNSAAGLAGTGNEIISLDRNIYLMMSFAFAGGLPGSYFGSQRFNLKVLKFILGTVLIFASYKLIFI